MKPTPEALRAFPSRRTGEAGSAASPIERHLFHVPRKALGAMEH